MCVCVCVAVCRFRYGPMLIYRVVTRVCACVYVCLPSCRSAPGHRRNPRRPARAAPGTETRPGTAASSGGIASRAGNEPTRPSGDNDAGAGAGTGSPTRSPQRSPQQEAFAEQARLRKGHKHAASGTSIRKLAVEIPKSDRSLDLTGGDD